MGVEARVVLHAPDEASARHAARAAFDRIAELDSVMSDYRPDSELMRVCADGRTGRRTVSRDLHRVLLRARDITVLSDGAFDVTVGPLVRLWRAARREKRLPEPSAIAAARSRVGPENLLVADASPAITLRRPGMLLDLGGIGKGFAADEALAVLAAAGHPRSLVDVGGDIAVGDAPPDRAGWRIATVASPRFLQVANCGVATSGDTRQFVEIGGVRYSHIVDPATGLGLTNRSPVTVIAADATTADALASAVSVLGPRRGRALVDRLEDASILTRRVFIIGIDGLRADALPVARTPNLDRLIAAGCYADRARTGEITVRGPSASRGPPHTTANIVDVAATAIAHLGVDIDPAWDLDGRAVGLDAPAVLGVNLIFNGDAEYGRGRDTAQDNAGIGGWTDTGAMTVIRYDAPEGFPGMDSPGPPHRGNNFFCGGAAAEAQIEQVIDVASLVEAIDLDRVSWELSGWFGGFAGQRDLASLTATFLDACGGELGRARIGYVTAADRGGVSGLQRRSAGAMLPPGTRRIVVRLFAEAGSGRNDGYADELSLILAE